MNGLTLLWIGILIAIFALFSSSILATGKTLLGKFWPASKTNTTVIGIQNQLGTIANASQFALGHEAVWTLRLLDVGNPTLDLGQELNTIEQKIHAVMKAQNSPSPPV